MDKWEMLFWAIVSAVFCGAFAFSINSCHRASVDCVKAGGEWRSSDCRQPGSRE